jgi:hypothetical protein
MIKAMMIWVGQVASRERRESHINFCTETETNKNVLGDGRITKNSNKT